MSIILPWAAMHCTALHRHRPRHTHAYTCIHIRKCQKKWKKRKEKFKLWCSVEIEVRFRDYVCLLVEGYINVHISPHSLFQLFLSSLFLSILSFLPSLPLPHIPFFFVGGEGRGIRKHPHSFYLFFFLKISLLAHTHTHTPAHPHTHIHLYGIKFSFLFFPRISSFPFLRPALYFNALGRSNQDDIEGLSRSELSTLSLPFHPRHATRSDAHEREKKPPGLAHRSFHPSAPHLRSFPPPPPPFETTNPRGGLAFCPLKPLIVNHIS